MRLYFKEKNWDDYWEVRINFPWMGKRHKHADFTGEPIKEYGFSFPTECFLRREDEFYWCFTLKFLGFGFTIIRQNGY
jgi:hypothetical protein